MNRHNNDVSLELCLEHIIDSHNPIFDAFYKLYEDTFDPNVIEPKERYKMWISSTKNGKHPFPYVLVVGHSSSLPDKIISFTSGNYMPLLDENFKPTQRAIGAIGHTATLEELRRKGYGSRVLSYFETTAKKLTEERNKEFIGLVCEAENRSVGFWHKSGFKELEDVIYFQPPLIFDPNTGERQYDEVQENLVIKSYNAKKTLPKSLVRNIVRTMYEYWCVPKPDGYFGSGINGDLNNPVAYENARSYIHEVVFKKFENSLSKIPGGHIKLKSKI